jgi:hypothetical protein
VVDTPALVQAFIDRTLPKPLWTHEAHLRVGLWHVRRHGPDEALRLLRDRITRYNEAVGTANTDDSGYHETLTVFYVRIIAAFVAEHRGAADLEARLIAERGARDLPLQYYTRERLFSIPARRQWRPPDLQPLPEMAQPPPSWQASPKT